MISLFVRRMLSSAFLQGEFFMSVNKVILVGRLGRDPETRYTGGGQAVANFSVATDETYKDRNGERQKRTEWHKIVVWGKQAEIAQQYLKKGSLIFIEGRIQSREWQDKEGQKRTSFEIVASNFRMLGGRGDGGGSGGGGATGSGGRATEEFDQAGPGEEAGGGHAGPEISDDDIPF
jgi:single-strand DNA-binding protein